MNDFVEQCLREWRRLGVPTEVANEMAADLDADLADAAADNVAQEEVLGNGIFDPPSFARSWAAARGVIPTAPASSVPRSDRRRIAALALATLAVLGAGLLAIVVLHPAARVVSARPSAFAAPDIAHPRFLFPPPGAVVQQPVGVGAPVGILVFGLLAITLLAAGAWFVWRRS